MLKDDLINPPQSASIEEMIGGSLGSTVGLYCLSIAAATAIPNALLKLCPVPMVPDSAYLVDEDYLPKVLDKLDDGL